MILLYGFGIFCFGMVPGFFLFSLGSVPAGVVACLLGPLWLGLCVLGVCKELDG